MPTAILRARLRAFGLPCLLAMLPLAAAPLAGSAIQDPGPKPLEPTFPKPKLPKPHPPKPKIGPKVAEKEPKPPKKHPYLKKHTGRGGHPAPKKTVPPHPPATHPGTPK